MRLVTLGIVQQPSFPLKSFNLLRGEEGRLWGWVLIAFLPRSVEEREEDRTYCLSGCKILPKVLKMMNFGIN